MPPFSDIFTQKNLKAFLRNNYVDFPKTNDLLAEIDTLFCLSFNFDAENRKKCVHYVTSVIFRGRRELHQKDENAACGSRAAGCRCLA